MFAVLNLTPPKAKKPIPVCKTDLTTPTSVVVRAEQTEVHRNWENTRRDPLTISKENVRRKLVSENSPNLGFSRYPIIVQ